MQLTLAVRSSKDSSLLECKRYFDIASSQACLEGRTVAKSSQVHQQESQDSKAPQLSALRKTRLQVKADQKQFLMEKTIETNKQTVPHQEHEAWQTEVDSCYPSPASFNSYENNQSVRTIGHATFTSNCCVERVPK